MFSGVSKNEFAPDETATRAMLVTVLSRLTNADMESFMATNPENSFADVAESDWFYTPVLWAAEHGIVTGVAADRFAPGENVTREQMAVLLYRYAQREGIKLKDGEEKSFADDADISEWAKDAVSALTKAGILNGKDGNRFDAKGTATRAELATMLVRFVEEYMTEADETEAAE